MEGKYRCDICGRDDFKSPQALSGHKQFKHSEQAQGTQAQTTAVAKKGQSPLEQLVQELKLPVMVDGQARIFDSGVEYGVRSVLMGVRVAQELSAMGVQQAVPIIKMAQEMRESEGQAAKIIAAELAGATLEGNKELRSAIGQLGSQITSSGPNPMLSTFMSMMQPYLGQTMEGLMKGFGKGKMGAMPNMGVLQGEQKERKEQAPPASSTPGVEIHSIDEIEEEG